MVDKKMNNLNSSFGLGQRMHPFFLTSMKEITKPNKSIEEIEMQQLIEEIKPIKGYEGLYSISNYGYAISEKKEWTTGNHNSIRKKEETVLKTLISNSGYLGVVLCKNGKHKAKIHILVWEHFGIGKRNGRILQVDHKDEDKLNCRIDNLQLLSNRQNVSKYYKTQKHSSIYTGVSWDKKNKKWQVVITINKKLKHLGLFTNEYSAHLRYEEALRKVIC